MDDVVATTGVDQHGDGTEADERRIRLTDIEQDQLESVLGRGRVLGDGRD